MFDVTCIRNPPSDPARARSGPGDCREPRGTIDQADYEKVRDGVKAKLEATADDKGVALHTRVFKPEEIYKTVRNVAPDLIVHFGDLYWRSIGGVGYPTIHVQENDTGPDDCNHAQFGSFILAAPNNPLQGEVDGTHIVDLAPTLLELGGYDLPNSMQGRSLAAGRSAEAAAGHSADAKEVLRARLRGLGYIE